ncbi:hypothetical protein LWM68_36725 [Niabella sp. W65]|nr:hypothetical protein [Niabella sp. W65]MCH7367806.1 hypothetical protein [Niabella sp. W65]
MRDISIEDQYSYRNGKIVYAAYESHPRWRWVSYNVIKVLDIATGQQRSLTHRSRYFSPDISADGKKIAANKVYLDGSSSLVLLSADNGRVIKEIKKKACLISPIQNSLMKIRWLVFCVIRTQLQL